MKLESKTYWDNLLKKSITKFFILGVLYDRKCHGYGLVSLVRSSSCGTCSPSFGTIYPTLRTLLDGGYVKLEEVDVKKRRRKVYSLTARGIRAYRAALASFGEHVSLLSNVCVGDLTRIANKLKTD